MGKLLYKPSEECKKQANLTRFISFVSETFDLMIDSYDELYDWSIEKIPDFWVVMWEFAQIKASRRYDKVVDDLTKFPGASWFGDARLNFAENLLGYRDGKIAFVPDASCRLKAREYNLLYDDLQLDDGGLVS